MRRARCRYAVSAAFYRGTTAHSVRKEFDGPFKNKTLLHAWMRKKKEEAERRKELVAFDVRELTPEDLRRTRGK